MEFIDVLEMRRSTRKYQEKQLSKDQIRIILEAANRAPVGSNLYRDIHITIVQNQEILLKLCEAAWKRFASKRKLKEIAGNTLLENSTEGKKPNLFYSAPTVFIVSHRKQSLQPGIEWANTASVVNQMHLAATEIGLGSCYMWGALESMRMFPELDHTELLEIPVDFAPLIALAAGYPASPLEKNELRHEPFGTNIIR